MNIFRGLYDEGRTIILVTHEPEIATYASRNVIIARWFDCRGFSKSEYDACTRRCHMYKGSFLMAWASLIC